MKKKRGGQKGNRNALKLNHEKKRYYPRPFFGLRWEYPIGEAIDIYLQSFESQRAWLEEFLLPELPEIASRVEPKAEVEMQFKVSSEVYEFLKASGLEPECLEKLVIEEEGS